MPDHPENSVSRDNGYRPQPPEVTRESDQGKSMTQELTQHIPHGVKEQGISSRPTNPDLFGRPVYLTPHHHKNLFKTTTDQMNLLPVNLAFSKKNSEQINFNKAAVAA